MTLATTTLTQPFARDTWKRTAYLLLAVPTGLLCIPLGLVAPRSAGRIQLALAGRLLGGGGPEGPRAQRPRTGALAFAHAVLTVPVNLAAAVVTFYLWSIVAMNLGYPLRPGLDTENSWGGPSLAGAWALHAGVGGLGFLLLTPWVVRGFSALQARLVAGFLSTGQAGLGRTVGLALGVSAVCAVLCVPVVHQL
ncbi:sensor domain-containing protein [Streptomyces boncukensis]|uniref:Uncharacterized protein n=1 Tax=Streptomyces boncukensis TaxID=2711219 RepID=A0A6G4X0W9_9ACTN|nr:sensor domain-containing protein [Streptomyces boncukensis]NGO70311.1 hypothetical protein [Streptomyces boncukensis]